MSTTTVSPIQDYVHPDDQTQPLKEKFVVVCSSPHKTSHREIARRSLAREARNVSKSVKHVQSCCFVIKRIAFLAFLSPSSSPLQKRSIAHAFTCFVAPCKFCNYDSYQFPIFIRQVK